MKKSMVLLSILAVCLGAINAFATEPVPVKGQPWAVSSLGMPFIYVEPGSFQMGSNDGDSNEKPVHQVTISKGYWIGKYEVTQKEYQSIMGNKPSYFKGGKRPVEQVSWNDAVSFCRKLTEQESAAGRLPSGYEYCLPTEAEWEFAARWGAGSKGYKYSGSDDLDSVAWYESNSDRTTHDVGLKAPNELGIYDIIGNVWEWCLDDWHSNYDGAPSDGSQWCDEKDSITMIRLCVIRGGSWSDYTSCCRVAGRGGNPFIISSRSIGFRVVLAPVSK